MSKNKAVSVDDEACINDTYAAYEAYLSALKELGRFSSLHEISRIEIRSAFEAKRVAVMKRVRNELKVWLKESSEREASVMAMKIDAVSSLIREIEGGAEQREIDRILAREKIGTPREYELVARFVDAASHSQTAHENIASLNELLVHYHQGGARK